MMKQAQQRVKMGEPNIFLFVPNLIGTLEQYTSLVPRPVTKICSLTLPRLHQSDTGDNFPLLHAV